MASRYVYRYARKSQRFLTWTRRVSMKNMNFLLALALAAAIAPFAVSQDATSGASTSPTSQSAATTSSGQTSSGSASSGSSTQSASSNDGDLTQQLQTKFSQDPAFANVQVSVTKGTAMITGTVASKADRKRAKEMAKSIAGVKHVKEQLTVNTSAGKSTTSKSNEQTDASTGSSSTAGQS